LLEAISKMLQNSSYGQVVTTKDGLDEHNEGYVVGVDLGGTNLRLALADSTGAVLARWGASTAGIRDANLIVRLIGEGVDQVVENALMPRAALRAIAAGAPGITDVDAGVVIATSYLMSWRNVPLRDMLEEALGVPAAVDNDVNLAALGEGLAGAAKGTGDFVFIAIGTGVGAGIVLNHRLFRGNRWTAGEIGYMLVPGVSEDPVERGKPGALEAFVGGEGIREQWNRRLREGNSHLPKDLNATQIFDLAVEGSSVAQDILAKAARILAYAIHNISLILNCPLFVLGGSVGVHPALCDAIRKVLQQSGARVQPQIKRSLLGTDAQLIGAVGLALDTANARPPLML
jgi:glucokinase